MKLDLPVEAKVSRGNFMRVGSGETQAAVADWAGNSVSMIRRHYDGLAKKKEAEAFYKIRPKQGSGKVIPMDETVGE